MKIDLRGAAPLFDENDQTPNARSPWTTFWITSVDVFLVGIDTEMLFAAFKVVRTTIPAGYAADLSRVNAYKTVYTGMLVRARSSSDSHGRKTAFLLGVGIFALSSARCGPAGTVPLLIGALAVHASLSGASS